jgi:hypothetical protein
MRGMSTRAVGPLFLLLSGLWVALSCSQSPSEAGSRPSPEPPPPPSEPLSLVINGFNYTDLYIDRFEVNGQWGGNLFVSSPLSGGGKGVCCVRWVPDRTAPVRVTVRWTRDRKRWCTQQVELDTPLPAHPRYLAVHFFPDGHLEAELSEDTPPLRLSLEQFDLGQRKPSGNSVADEHHARCRDDAND